MSMCNVLWCANIKGNLANQMFSFIFNFYFFLLKESSTFVVMDVHLSVYFISFQRKLWIFKCRENFCCNGWYLSLSFISLEGVMFMAVVVGDFCCFFQFTSVGIYFVPWLKIMQEGMLVSINHSYYWLL